MTETALLEPMVTERVTTSYATQPSYPKPITYPTQLSYPESTAASEEEEEEEIYAEYVPPPLGREVLAELARAVEQLVTEDDTPVDNIASSKNQRCLINPIYDDAYLPVPFLADCNVALYASPNEAAIVPDMFLSLGVEVPKDWWKKQNRSYLIWEYGKAPDAVVEIVSNKVGGETDEKKTKYARKGITYYAIYDPQKLLMEKELEVYELTGGAYVLRPDTHMPNIGLSLTIWEGVFEQGHNRWLRWCDMAGNILLSGAERAEKAETIAQQERIKAQQAETIAQQERTKAQQAEEIAAQAKLQIEHLTERLRQLGIDPSTL